MTPEREAQMRELLQKWWLEPEGFGLRAERFTEPGEAALAGFLACARALEPMVRDGERYRFLRDEGHDDCGDGPWSDAYAAIASTNGPEYIDTTVDAAMSAALEDGNATE